MPAHITAKIVIASAARFTPVRHRCRSKNKIAEISVPACPIPIHHTKFTMSHAHITGCRFPHTPTPVDIWYVSMNSRTPIQVALGMNNTHHQIGALSSHNEAIRFEIHPKLRLFATNGMRSSSVGVWCRFAGGVRPAISALLSPLHARPRRPLGLLQVRRHAPGFPAPSKDTAHNPAYSGSDCALSPNMSVAASSANTPAPYNPAPNS